MFSILMTPAMLGMPTDAAPPPGPNTTVLQPPPPQAPLPQTPQTLQTPPQPPRFSWESLASMVFLHSYTPLNETLPRSWPSSRS